MILFVVIMVFFHIIVFLESRESASTICGVLAHTVFQLDGIYIVLEPLVAHWKKGILRINLNGHTTNEPYF
jgi:hypothetical protein